MLHRVPFLEVVLWRELMKGAINCESEISKSRQLDFP